ncbi:MAG: hypothetical protein IT196_11900 [Acidimicrobiales bacterium]|nr:hypothetical protein [Acidimicrobiales bacterium]
MSSLWTPGGEHPVEREVDVDATDAPVDPNEQGPLNEEQAAQLAAAAEEVGRIREQLAQAPAELIVANHVMGLYEFAAVHLNREAPNIEAARLAIDALGGLLDACKGRLGPDEATLVQARTSLQLVFVQILSAGTGPRTD